MKKYLTFALIAVLLTSSLVGCSSKTEVDELKTKVEELEQQVSSLTAEPVRPDYLMPEDEFKQLGHDILADVMMQLADYDIDNLDEGDDIFIDFDKAFGNELDEPYQQLNVCFSSDHDISLYHKVDDADYMLRFYSIHFINCSSNEIDTIIKDYESRQTVGTIIGNYNNMVYFINNLDESTSSAIEKIITSKLAQ